MPKYVLTGVDAYLGLVAASYTIALSQPGDEVVITSPKPAFIPRDLLKSWLAHGAKVLMVSYDDIANLIRAFTGADAVAFITASDALAGRRRRKQHANVVEACKEANVHRIIFAGPFNSPVGDNNINNMSSIDNDHADTERLMRESGLVWNFQGNHVHPHEVVPGVEHHPGGFFSTDVAEEQECNANENWELVLGTLLLSRAHSGNQYAATSRNTVEQGQKLQWDTRNKHAGNSVPMHPILSNAANVEF